MTNKKTSVFGIFDDTTVTEAAVDSLRTAGFSSNDISVLFPDKHSTKDFAHEKNTKAPEGATTGATAGAVLGGTFGWLVGIGALAIPGVGPFVAAGPIMALLAGAGVGGALGGLSGALIGMGMPEFEAKRYEGKLKSGGILLSVHTDDSEEIDAAKDILKRHGAHDIVCSGESDAPSDESRRDTRKTDYIPGQTRGSVDINPTL